MRLVQAAALAAMLVPLGSVTAAADPVGCGPTEEDPYLPPCEVTITRTYSPEDRVNTYHFAGHEVVLEFFDEVLATFDLPITAVQEGPGQLEERGAGDCVTYSPEGNCIVIRVEDSPTLGRLPMLGTEFTSHYDMLFFWFDPIPDSARMLHAEGPDVGGPFDEDITFLYDPDIFPNDPVLGGRDDNFREFVAVARAPEPATFLLLGAGIVAAARRRSRRVGRVF